MTDTPKTPSKIIINGQEIGPDNVPDLLRRFVTDANQDGIPDFMEKIFKNPIFKAMAGKSMENLQHQLQTMKNLTPEQRQKISGLMQKLGASGQSSAVTSVPSISSVASISMTPSVSKPSGGQTQSSPMTIDYKALGIEDPDQKHAPSLGWVVAAVLLGVMAIAVWMFLKR